MHITLIGVGQAGGRLVDAFLEIDSWLCSDPVRGACAIDTSRAYLEALSAVPDDRRQLIGTDRAKGHGVGANNELATTIAREERSEILDAVDELPLDSSEAILTIAGLGGGTGSGATPAIAEAVRERYDSPVYGLGVLPQKGEPPVRTLNAARSLRSLRQSTDHVFLFDNDAWIETAPDEEIYRELNATVATAVGTLFGSLDNGEIGRTEGEDRAAAEYTETVLSRNALSAIGFATESVRAPEEEQGLLGRLWPSSTEPSESDPDEWSERIEHVIRQAVSPPYTLPTDASEATDAGLFVVAPEQYCPETVLSKEESGTIERLDPTHFCMCEPTPTGDTSGVAAICVLTSERFDRVTQLTERAVALQNDPSQIDRQRSDQLPGIVDVPANDEASSEEDGDLKPLF